MKNSTTNTSKNPILFKTPAQVTEQNLRKEISSLKETVKSQSNEITALEKRNSQKNEQVKKLRQENSGLKEKLAKQRKQLKNGASEVRVIKRELRQTRLKLEESEKETRKLKAQANPEILKMHLNHIDFLEKENAELKKQVKRLSKFKLKSGTEPDTPIISRIQSDFVQKLLELFQNQDHQLTLSGPLLSELRRSAEIILETPDLSKADQKKIQKLEAEKEEVEKEKKIYDRKENRKIRGFRQEIESEINEETFRQLKAERSSKYQQDRQFNQKIAEIKEKEEQIIETRLTGEEEQVLQAITNTINESERRNNRNSKNSSIPPSQQGLNKANNRLPEELKKKRGAPAGHQGYRFDFDGLNLSGLNEAKLKELSEKFPVETVYLSPQDIPEDAVIRNKSTRIAFGMVKSPCILVYVQQEAVSKNPENKRQLIKKTACYPDWLKKDYTYSPEYHTEALFLRLQLHSSYAGIARYFNESYGLPVIPKTVWNRVHRAALKANEVCQKIREELKQSKYLGIDETGFRDEGLTKWVFATTSKDWTLFTLSDHRNFDGLMDNGVLLNAAQGTVVIRDGFPIYEDERLSHLSFGRCWAHAIRSAKQIQEFEETDNVSLKALKSWFLKARDLREKAIEEGKSALKPAVLQQLTAEFDTVVAQGLKNSDPTKILYKRKTRHLLIRRAMKKILQSREVYFNFLQETPPSPSPWNGSELSGRKNPEAIRKLSKIANRIDLAVAQAQRDKTNIPEKKRLELEKAFFEQVEKTYEEYKDSKATVNFKTLPQIVEETTLVYNFFKDLKKDRDQFLLFITDLKADITNNNTETAIRPLKRAINTSGSFRGYANDHTSLESYISSARKQQLNLKDAFDELVHNNTSFLFDKELNSSSKRIPTIKTKSITKS